jgi:MFS superfamily sulfate permease-like transporter
VETKISIQITKISRSWFFEKINKIDKPLARLIRRHRDSILINKIRYEKGDITTEHEEIQNIIRSCYKRLYSTKLENLDEMENFLDRYQVPKLNQDQINDLNNPLSPREIEVVINSLPTKKTQDQMGLVQSSIRPSKKT